MKTEPKRPKNIKVFKIRILIFLFAGELKVLCTILAPFRIVLNQKTERLDNLELFFIKE